MFQVFIYLPQIKSTDETAEPEDEQLDSDILRELLQDELCRLDGYTLP